VDDHGGDVALDRNLVGGHGGDLPRELFLALQVVLRWVHLHIVQDHALPPLVSVADWYPCALLRKVAALQRQARCAAHAIHLTLIYSETTVERADDTPGNAGR